MVSIRDRFPIFKSKIYMNSCSQGALSDEVPIEIDESDAEGLLAEGYAKAKALSPLGIVAPIIKTMSLRPDFLAAIQAASRMHFTDGALTRAPYEMVASYVSALNRCRY